MPRSMPLAQTTSGARGRQRRGDRLRCRPHRLGRHHEQRRVGIGEVGEVGGRPDALMQAHAGEVAGVLARLAQAPGAVCVAHPETDLASGERRRIGERRPPGAAADDGDALEAHRRGRVTP